MTTPEATILFADDDPEMRSLFEEVITEQGYKVETSESGEEALVRLSEVDFDILVTDLRMHGMTGLDLMRQALAASPNLVVLIVTAFGTIDTAVEAMKQGAFHFITKPFKTSEMLATIDKAAEVCRLKAENVRLKKEVLHRYSFANILGRSKEMQELFSLIERVAEADDHVLITGESGTGKELVAKALHYNSRRRNRPFLAVNCSSLPHELLESELFGHVRGAFTGAMITKQGLFEAADGGTIFLDEIGDMEKALQAKILRALETKGIRAVGATSEKQVSVRVVTATNRDLAEEVRKGTFRKDLYYRLNVIRLRIPPLRARVEDIPMLVDHFLERFNQERDGPPKKLGKNAMTEILRHPWPGNVRELENAIRRACLMTGEETIDSLDLDIISLREGVPCLDKLFEHRVTIPQLENSYISYALDRTGGDKTQAARILGISKRTIHRRDPSRANRETKESPSS